MNKKFSTIIMLLCCILIVSCSNEDERNNLSVIGTWNATTLIEGAVYTDLEKAGGNGSLNPNNNIIIENL